MLRSLTRLFLTARVQMLAAEGISVREGRIADFDSVHYRFYPRK
ncbi:MAG: hypothetical protein V1743_05225 [Nanoarchaeota archaeon]